MSWITFICLINILSSQDQSKQIWEMFLQYKERMESTCGQHVCGTEGPCSTYVQGPSNDYKQIYGSVRNVSSFPSNLINIPETSKSRAPSTFRQQTLNKYLSPGFQMQSSLGSNTIQASPSIMPPPREVGYHPMSNGVDVFPNLPSLPQREEWDPIFADSVGPITRSRKRANVIGGSHTKKSGAVDLSLRIG